MTDRLTSIHASIENSISVKQTILKDVSLLENLDACVGICVDHLQKGGKIWFAGNGGSAADAQHLAAELSGRFYLDRRPLPAEALHVNTSFLTAVANDYGFDQVYARLFRGSARKDDVLIALSTSGNSTNILNVIGEAKLLGVPVIGMTGATGGRMANLCTQLLNVPSDDTPRIQECHIMLGHVLCELIEKELFA